MMRSLYSGVAGLRTHQTKMDVIGNNIANVNTTAFKSSSIVFQDLMSQTTQRASGANATTGRGGINARQIGLGVKSGAININVTGQGAAQSTGNPFDIMITGSNFFVVSDGLQNYFTRDGSFYVDGMGNLAMTSTGYTVMGWQVDPETGNIYRDNVTALRIMSTANMTYPPEATTQAYMDGIIDKYDTDVTSANGKVVNLNFFDARGYEYTARFVFKQSDDVDTYSLELKEILDEDGNKIDLGDGVLFGNANTTQIKSGKVSFDTTNYTWDATGKLIDNGTGEVLADLGQMYQGGVLKARNEECSLTWTDKETNSTVTETRTVQEQLDAIAKAYGYEGATEEFLNLLVDAPGDDGPPVVEGARLSVQEMLNNLAQTPGGVAVGAGMTLPAAAFETVGRLFDGVTIAFDHDNGDFAGVNGQQTVQDVILSLSALGGNFSDITINLGDLCSLNNKGTSTTSATSGSNDPSTLGVGSGRRPGDMIGVSIQQDGMIYASYDNGMTRLLGQIATAAFANASGLEKQGDNLYSATMNSGEFNGIGVDVTEGGGYMTTGQLEMSNVDLSLEFTEMITTQRGFQANSRIITVSDTLLEELTNLKR
ncbi:MAG: flagellar hook-basal body complex protein [Acetatifactor sp.]|nr:flagellar hook-basal body complex protein [Acetatifactor sp.]